MKILITILIVVGVAFGAYKLWDYWETVQSDREKTKTSAPQVVGEQLQGLPRQLEPALKDAEKGGPRTLKDWLDKAKRAGIVKDPRLAWVELEYVVMITKDDPLEAKRIFSQVKNRTPTDSPVYPQIKLLEKNYE
jgi:hypothetical protein